MKSAKTMNDHERMEPARAGRRPVGESSDAALRLPFGVAGVAGLFAVALGLVGLLMPRAWLETISFQLYLDQITSAALPPLGTTAQILAAVALALGGALFGWLIGRLFGVRPSSLSFHSLLNRLRGIGAGDEDDAPSLRAADRHPDAPARRPFSAARDIARYEDEWDEEDDALLLDSPFAAADDVAPTPPPLGATTGTSFDDHWREPPVRAQPPMMPQASGLVDDAHPFDLPAPSLEDWEAGSEPAPVVARTAFPPATPATPVPPPAVAVSPPEAPLAPRQPAPPPPAMVAEQPVMPAPAPIIRHAGAPEPAPQAWVQPDAASPTFAQRASLPPVEPLDLSAARLDDLLARLENGLGRRNGQAPSTPAASAIAGLSADMGEEGLAGDPAIDPNHGQTSPAAQPSVSPWPTAGGAPARIASAQAAAPSQDPAYPQDPALAAALRTLRRLNQQATA